MKKIKQLFSGSIFRSIMSSYIIICGIILLGTMAGYIYNYHVLESNTKSLAVQRAQIMAANFDKEFAYLTDTQMFLPQYYCLFFVYKWGNI